MTHIWLMRLLLGALLFFGSEILLWADPLARPPESWLLLVPGYLVLAVLLLDLLVRYKIRDLWGLMVLAGIYGLLNSLLLNPDTALADVPRTLVTRALGAHALLGLEMLGLFIALVQGRSLGWRRVLVLGTLVVGLAWGVWMRLSPAQLTLAAENVSPVAMLLYGLGGLAPALLLFGLLVRPTGPETGRAFVLPLPGLLALVALLLALFLLRVAQGYAADAALIISGLVLLLSVAILWFRRETKLPTLLDNALPLRPLPARWLLFTLGLFASAAIATYHLPLIGTAALNQLSIIVFGFTLYGLGWLPTVSLILGLRFYVRQIQGRKL